MKTDIKEQIENNLLAQDNLKGTLKELEHKLIQLQGEQIEQSRASCRKKFEDFVASLTELEREVCYNEVGVMIYFK